MNKNKDFYTHNEVVNSLVGAKGTPERTAFDTETELFLIGRKIKEIRESKKMTQETLGKLIGVQKAQISKIENGKNLTISTIVKIFNALGASIKLQIENKDIFTYQPIN